MWLGAKIISKFLQRRGNLRRKFVSLIFTDNSSIYKKISGNQAKNAYESILITFRIGNFVS
jgi:hypothetical protein